MSYAHNSFKQVRPAKTEREALARWGFGEPSASATVPVADTSEQSPATAQIVINTAPRYCPKTSPRYTCESVEGKADQRRSVPRYYLTPIQPRVGKQRLRRRPRTSDAPERTEICEDCRLTTNAIHRAGWRRAHGPYPWEIGDKNAEFVEYVRPPVIYDPQEYAMRVAEEAIEEFDAPEVSVTGRGAAQVERMLGAQILIQAILGMTGVDLTGCDLTLGQLQRIAQEAEDGRQSQLDEVETLKRDRLIEKIKTCTDFDPSGFEYSLAELRSILSRAKNHPAETARQEQSAVAIVAQ